MYVGGLGLVPRSSIGYSIHVVPLLIPGISCYIVAAHCTYLGRNFPRTGSSSRTGFSCRGDRPNIFLQSSAVQTTTEELVLKTRHESIRPSERSSFNGSTLPLDHRTPLLQSSQNHSREDDRERSWKSILLFLHKILLHFTIN